MLRTLCVYLLRCELIRGVDTHLLSVGSVHSRGQRRWLALLEGDRGVRTERDVLPLVAGRRSQRDLEGEPLALASHEAAERDARRQLVDTGRLQVTRDGHRELGVVASRQLATGEGGVERVGGRERDVTSDAAGVRRVEALRQRLARLQVGEVEVEGVAAAVVVAQGEHQLGRRDVHPTVVGRGEVGTRNGLEQQSGRDAGDAEGTEGTNTLLSCRLEGHSVPFLWQDATIEL